MFQSVIIRYIQITCVPILSPGLFYVNIDPSEIRYRTSYLLMRGCRGIPTLLEPEQRGKSSFQVDDDFRGFFICLSEPSALRVSRGAMVLLGIPCQNADDGLSRSFCPGNRVSDLRFILRHSAVRACLSPPPSIPPFFPVLELFLLSYDVQCQKTRVAKFSRQHLTGAYIPNRECL